MRDFKVSFLIRARSSTGHVASELLPGLLLPVSSTYTPPGRRTPLRHDPHKDSFAPATSFQEPQLDPKSMHGRARRNNRTHHTGCECRYALDPYLPFRMSRSFSSVK